VPWRTACEERAVVEVLACLRKYGQRLDVEIARETGVSLEEVRKRLLALAAVGAVVTCKLTRFEHGERLDAWLCRVSGYVPPRAPGRKATGS
jgi:transcription initiation factor IIE alpha subunit